MADGYYLARHHDDSTFVVLREDSLWYACGVQEPLNDRFHPDIQIIRKIDTSDG